MRNRVSGFALLAIALVFAAGSTAFGGENADAVVTLTSANEVNAGPGETIAVALSASGLVDVKQMSFTVQVSPKGAADFSVYPSIVDGFSTLIVPPVGGYIGAQYTGPDFPDGKDGDKVRVAFGAMGGSGVSGDDISLGALTLVSATDDEFTLTVSEVTLGKTANEKDVLTADNLNISITVNPPVPPVIEPTLAASSDQDASLDYGDAVTFSVSATDATGKAAAGQTITWTISNNGSETVELADGSQIRAGSDGTADSNTNANGVGSVVISAEADRGAGTTSITVEASMTADNSEGTERELAVEFSATWDVPVPAELASFAGDLTVNNQVVLHWGVASQSNNLGWQVYRSTNNATFGPVGELVAGEGTTDQYRTYTFNDIDLPKVDVVFYYLRQIDLDGSTARSDVIEVALGTTLVMEQALPVASDLRQNFPNPFNPETTISFDLDSQTIVSLKIYDVGGQLVKELVRGESYPAGRYERLWDGRDKNGVAVASGLYLYRIDTEKFTAMKKMVLLK